MFSGPHDDIPFPDDLDEVVATAMRHLERGRACLDVGRVAQATAEFSHAAALLPDAAEPHLMLSAAAYQASDYADGLRHADRAIALEPDEGWGHRLRFWSLRALGKKAQAMEAARRSVELEPESDAALYALLLSHLDNRNVAAAEQTLRQLEAVAPDDEDTHEAAALTYLARKQYRQAETAARDALAINPESAYAFRYLGDALWGQKQRQAAYEAYRTAGLIAPNDQYVQAALSRRLEERVFPGWLIYWRELVNVVGAVVVCWGATVVTGQAAVGWTLTFFHLAATTVLYTLDDNMYLMYWRRDAWQEVPPEVQAYCWRAKLATTAPLHSLIVMGISILTLIALTCLCLGYPVGIAPDRDVPMKFIAWPVLLVQFILFCRGLGAYTKAQELVNRSKPVELLSDEDREQLAAADREAAEQKEQKVDVPQPVRPITKHVIPPPPPPPQNPWAMMPPPSREES